MPPDPRAPAELPLDELQRWVQAMLLAPESPGPRVAEVFKPSARMAAEERVEVYRRMIRNRFEEVVGIDFPTLRALVGDQAFEALARDYSQAFPSRSYTLGPFAYRLPEHLEAVGAPRAWIDLALLELTVARVFDAPSSPSVSPEVLAGIAEQDWEQLRLVPAHAFARVALSSDAVSLFTRHQAGRPIAVPSRPRRSFARVFRQGHASPTVTKMSAAEFALLEALCTGSALGPAIEAHFEPERHRAREQQLFAWLRSWFQDGLFQAIH